ncbi:Eukaryotic translation initiation factor 3 subunit A [Bienertia sinuspersici]
MKIIFSCLLIAILDLESDSLRNHLTVLADSLYKARSMIYPPLNKTSKIGDTLHGLAEVVKKEHKKLLARKIIIEQRKEEQERQLLEKPNRKDLLSNLRTGNVSASKRKSKNVKGKKQKLYFKGSWLREKQEMEKKLQKVGKQMDHLERAKREEAAPLIEAAYQQRLLEVELSRQRHYGDLKEKNRLARVMENKLQNHKTLCCWVSLGLLP